MSSLHSDEVSRLIDKAVWAWSSAPENTRTKDHLIGLSKLQAYATVAADVLCICTAPFAFELAIREAVRKHPRPSWTTRPRERAEELRETWLGDIRADVIGTLGGN